MARILITSGPTRQYLDPVRFLTNASSGRMGAALAAAAVAAGHEVLVVSGPVSIEYPEGVDVVRVVSTEEMLRACQTAFSFCDGMIAVAAPCDYRPREVSGHKIRKDGQPLIVELIETPDIVAALAADNENRWVVGFALETDDPRFRAMQKLERKNCDLICVNGPSAMQSEETSVEILARGGAVVASFSGTKTQVAQQIMQTIAERLIPQQTAETGE